MKHFFLATLFLLGCSSSSGATDAATPDVQAVDTVTVDTVTVDTPPPMDVRADVANDAVTVDRPDVVTLDAPDVTAVDRPDVVDAPDVAVVDRPDASAACTSAGCHAYWCGCGRCDPATITCTPDARVCPLACAQACPELDTAVCNCTGGTCAPPVFPDAGVDAGGGEGAECTTASECGAGLLCCYPCGIPGCHNRCMAPMDGHCPLIP